MEIKQIKTNTPEERVKEIINLKEEIKEIKYFEHKEKFYADIYYNTSKKKEQINEKDKEFKVTEEQLERWKKIAVAKGTYGLLLAKGFSREDIKDIKSQYEAYICLENLKEENI